LINPNQLRENGLKVEDTPKRYNPASKHAITEDEIVIPLKSKGYISYIPVVKPSEVEVNKNPHIHMTGESWNPYDEDFELLESTAGKEIMVISSNKTSAVDPVELGKRLLIPDQQAARTLEINTILASRTFNEPRYTRYGHRFRWLGRRRIEGRFYTDTFMAHPSLANITQLKFLSMSIDMYLSSR